MYWIRKCEAANINDGALIYSWRVYTYKVPITENVSYFKKLEVRDGVKVWAGEAHYRVYNILPY